jgi:hypothetical protein
MFSRGEIMERLSVPADRLRVIPPASRFVVEPPRANRWCCSSDRFNRRPATIAPAAATAGRAECSSSPARIGAARP